MRHRIEQKADPAQETAIRHGAGPCAVIAGPGSGKTFVLAERIRCLIEVRGVDPSSILVLTFSRAAAAHMRRRFLDSCPHAETLFGTFHSVFFRILQESSPEKVRLIEPRAKRDYLRHLCEIRPDFLPEKATAEELQQQISRFKNGLPCSQKWIPALVHVYDDYLRGRGWLDFDDMILRCRELLQESPDILSLWRSRFRWLLVDEFQDVSPAQYQVLLLLAAPENNIFIVGDDDQSIYGFRGADPMMMQRFLSDFGQNNAQCTSGRPDGRRRTVTCCRDGKQDVHGKNGRDGKDGKDGKDDKDCKNCEIVFLTTNYRCPKAVLEVSSSLIRCNTNRIYKDFCPGSPLQGHFECRPFTDRLSEYTFVAQEISRMTPREKNQTAVIFRTHGAAEQFLHILTEHHISFLTAGSRNKPAPASDRVKILQDLISYYRVSTSLSASPRSGTVGQKISDNPSALKTGTVREDLIRVMNRPERYLSGSFIPYGDLTGDRLLARAGYEQNAVREMLRDLELLNSLSPAFSLRYLLDSVGYRAYARSASKNAGKILEELQEYAVREQTPSKWLRLLEELLETAVRQDEEGSSETDSTARTGIPAAAESDDTLQTAKYPRDSSSSTVRVLTMHACKGLEFDTVFIPDLNEGSVPSKRAWTPEQVEEERRLLYVAMTRAKRSLILTYLEGTPDRPAAPSRFLQSITSHSGSVNISDSGSV